MKVYKASGAEIRVFLRLFGPYKLLWRLKTMRRLGINVEFEYFDRKQ